MRKILSIFSTLMLSVLFLAVSGFTTVRAASSALYISPNGNDNNDGLSVAKPLKTFEKAISKATAGTTIYVSSGTYKLNVNMSGTINLAKSGSSGSPITIAASNSSSKPVLDFTGQSKSGNDNSLGFKVTGSYWTLRNIKIYNAGDNGVKLTGSTAGYNTFDYCEFDSNGDSGLQITNGAHHTTVSNCFSHDNYDQAAAGGNADGYACKDLPGAGNKFISCTAQDNSDDGWDFFNNMNAVELQGCTATHNGYHKGAPAGNGEGFKLGGTRDARSTGAHKLTNCTANNNRASGYAQNHGGGAFVITKCTATGNLKNNYNFPEQPISGKITFTDCYSYNGTVSILSGSSVITAGNLK
ncbi:right-handed parallel beta-helix repeat-containing protein [Clostridium manihotivorum]|uniref:Pectate lyase n=1 Tax=Clostridium manihotivorum TaxID=2320868 RepID=A0A3R5X051_9CLOT|nr:right-handed parallel beta-helix repeat-containing protein [Clostridium manihotivorum]QAA30980.1 pectate lyase [Clostridium manihotivorum]